MLLASDVVDDLSKWNIRCLKITAHYAYRTPIMIEYGIRLPSRSHKVLGRHDRKAAVFKRDTPFTAPATVLIESRKSPNL